MFPKLGGNRQGEQGDLSCLSLRCRGGIHCLPLSAKKDWQIESIQEAPGALELEPKHGGGECLLGFPMWAPPWGVAQSQEVPWAWADAQPHPDKGQLWGCDGHQGRLGQLLVHLVGREALPSLMWFRSYPPLPPCFSLWAWGLGMADVEVTLGPIMTEP